MKRTNMPTVRNGSKWDSNPGSLDCESDILPLSYRAPQFDCNVTGDWMAKCVSVVTQILRLYAFTPFRGNNKYLQRGVKSVMLYSASDLSCLWLI